MGNSVSSVIVSLRTANGPRGSRPETNIEGGIPVVEWVVYLPQHKAQMLVPHLWLIRCNLTNHRFPCAYQTFAETTLLRSIGTLKLGVHPNNFRNVVVKLLVKFDPQSDRIVVGIPMIWNSCNSALHTFLADKLRNGKANGHLVLLSHSTRA